MRRHWNVQIFRYLIRRGRIQGAVFTGLFYFGGRFFIAEHSESVGRLASNGAHNFGPRYLDLRSLILRLLLDVPGLTLVVQADKSEGFG